MTANLDVYTWAVSSKLASFNLQMMPHSPCRYKTTLVNEVLQRSKAVKRNNPVNIWKGPFRDDNPLLAISDKPWKPNGAAGISIASPREPLY